MNFVTLDQAKRHLHIHPTNTDHDVDILEKVLAASAIVFGHMNPQTIKSGWTVANTSPPVYNVPWKVKAATLLVLSDLYNNREASISDVMTKTVQNILGEYRDPPMA